MAEHIQRLLRFRPCSASSSKLSRGRDRDVLTGTRGGGCRRYKRSRLYRMRMFDCIPANICMLTTRAFYRIGAVELWNKHDLPVRLFLYDCVVSKGSVGERECS